MPTSILEGYRGPFDGASEPRTLIELLQRRALQQPDEAAYMFLDESGAVAAQIGYEALERRARSIARRLERTQASGERAMLLCGPGLDFHAAFLGCLYAGVVAVPVNLPRVNRNFERLRAVIADADVRLILTTAPLLPKLEIAADQLPDLKRCEWIAVDEVEDDTRPWQGPSATEDTLAFLQYTSGSTATPRGVRLSHANLLHNARLVHRAGRHAPGDKYVSWLPTFHDMGFMVGLLQPLYAGIPAVLMSPASFLQHPKRWLQAIAEHGATLSGGPDFAYRLCVERISPEQRADLDLRRWRIAFNGAEPVRAQTMDDFVAAFAPCGFDASSFYPCYGLAEATLMVSGSGGEKVAQRRSFSQSALERHRVAESGLKDRDAATLVSCGRVLGGQRLAIVDPHSCRRCGAGEVGEIWVSGPSVSDGYWNRPEHNAELFGARLEPEGEGPFLRTGDLGFLADSELYVTGRLKDLIIVRGANHYPQDIEQTVESVHPSLRYGCAAAFSVEIGGEEQLVVVQEAERREGLDPQALIDAIRQAISQRHELQTHSVVLVRKGTIAKTSSGKIQRHACKAAFVDGRLREIARDSLQAHDATPEASLILKTLRSIPAASRQPPLEVYLQEQASRLLKIPSRRLAHDLPLSTFGLDSLNAIEFKNTVECDLRVPIALSQLFEDATISDLARELAQALDAPAAVQAQAAQASPPESPESGVPLSYMQQSLWLTHQLAPASPAYNVALAVRIDEAIDCEALRGAVQDVVDRHGTLRAVFVATADGPRQIVRERQEAQFDTAEGAAERMDEALIALAHQPFDLSEGPVFRAALFTRSVRDHTLLLMAHHVVTDGRSMWMLLEETLSFYQARMAGRNSAALRPSSDYADFVRWQAQTLAGPRGEASWSYWRDELENLPVLDFPMASRRPPVRTFSGAELRFDVGPELAQALRDLAMSNRTTLYAVLLSAFQVLLHRYTGARDLVVGSPVQARPGAEFEGVAGCFFNVVALRCDLGADPRFSELLAQNRRKVLGALEHQDYPSHLLAQKLESERDPSRSPLFQATFLLQKPMLVAEGAPLSLQQGAKARVGGLEFALVPVERRFARNDLELEILEAQDGLLGSLQYNTDLFQRGDMQRLSAHYRQLLLAIVADPRQRVSQLPMSHEAERQRILGQWSQGEGGYVQAITVDALFATQAARTPEKVAAVHAGASRTFAQFNDEAERLATLIERLSS